MASAQAPRGYSQEARHYRASEEDAQRGQKDANTTQEMNEKKSIDKDALAKKMRLNGLRKTKKQELREERKKRLKEKGIL